MPFGLFDNRTKYVRARIWKDGNQFAYPEATLTSLAGKTDFGVAFSGGGTRSAAATTGQLRGLKAVGLLDKVKYISAVSGGAWASGPFTFLPAQFDEDDFLGAALDPDRVTISGLNDLPKRSMLRAASDSVITDDLLAEAAKLGGDETYSRAIGNVFLEPFDIDDNRKFMTFDQTTLADVLKENREEDDDDHYLQPGDFYLARAGRPYFIAGATIFNGSGSKPKIHTEFTPWYSGTRRFVRGPEPVGGGLVETVGMDSEKPDRWRRVVKVKLGAKRHRFSLADMLGTTGAAPQEMLRKLRVGFVGFPGLD